MNASPALTDGCSKVVLISSEMAKPDEGHYPLDRIRMQKPVFLLSMRGPSRWRDIYQYSPYDWGPYSAKLTSDVGYLIGAGVLRLQATSSRYQSHVASPLGNSIAQYLWQLLQPNEQQFLRDVHGYVTQKSFRDLLKEIYAAYPEYASRSRFSG